MAIKNAYSKINVAQLFAKLQKTLVKHGAKKLMFDYNNEGKVISLTFAIEFEGQMLPISLPANAEKVHQVLVEQGFKNDKEQAYRVAWRNVNDWVEAQLALIETEQVTMPQVFLPYVMVNASETYFDKFKQNQLLLEQPNQQSEVQG